MATKEFNCKEKCGICCFVCTEVYLSINEVESKKYEMRNYIHKPEIKGWGGKSLKQVKKLIPELGKLIYCCFYFEPKTKSCLIYDDRPYVCRQFNCRKTVKAKLNKIWVDVLGGKKTILLGGTRRITKEM